MNRIIITICIVFASSCFANGWQFNNMKIKQDDKYFEFSADTINSPYTETNISNISYSCLGTKQIYPLHKCKTGDLSFNYMGQSYDYILKGWIDLANNKWDITIANKVKNFQFKSESSNPDKFMFKITKMSLGDLSELIKQIISIDLTNVEAMITAEIEIDLAQDIKIFANYTIDNFTWESQNSDYVFADSSLSGRVEILEQIDGIKLDIITLINAGEGLFKDMYVLFDEYPVKIESKTFLGEKNQPTQTKFQLSASDAIYVNVDVIDINKEIFEISYQVTDLDVLYKGFLASYLEIIGIDQVDINGRSNGRFRIHNGNIIELKAQLTEISAQVVAKKTKLENVSGTLEWQQQGEFKNSNLSWNKLLVAGMPVKKSNIAFASMGQQLQLQDNTIIPIFDGELVIDKLSIRDLFKEQLDIDFGGEIKPISIALITEKMGWPLMKGTISGKIPGMKKKGHSITFDGSLELTLFDGQMQVDNLSIERLFGIAPVIASDIKFQNLNLQQLTSTFDFGEITGLVNGYVKGLRITNWKPDRLDAHIESIKTKKIKQTISQRAIDNISSIGGVQGALSRSFLRFFDYFKYKKIGIGCKLRNSICEMKGIKSTDLTSDTYKLIVGKGIPSINIIGFRKFIDWEIFIDRLLNASY